ncbi:alpha-amylase [Corynebacterium hindlerae]|uniref:Alpha-amylase n=1 Tax=Corynebacterium hindlerae TaxID=699041 RepID=A0A7G5FC06_9CORY|nr:alpha-amylase family glycosyl hydrolase [Corynebacterium hindlerae]QMV84147.1 alpha-amylase [Corynebacterium hindlerae]
MSHWSEHTIWWHAYPLGFTGAPVRPTPEERALTHRLDYLTDALDHLITLGCNGLALGPIFTSHTHGYDTTNYFDIDPRLGTMADFQKLVSACKQRGIRIMLDGVFNHVGAGSHYEHLVRPDTVFEGHADLHTLDHSREETSDLVAEVMNFWLDHGIDAWRLDAAYSVPLEFWRATLPKVYEKHPDAWIMGEVIHGDYAAFADAMNSVTQYELWKAIWSSLKDNNLFELDWNLQRHNTFLDSFTPYTFIGNHDVTRIATQVGLPKAALALTILMTVGGVPSIYYGDEFGYEGLKEERLGGDDAVRPMFHLGDSPMLALHQELIAFRRRHPWLTTARTTSTSLENTRMSYRSTGPNGEYVDATIELEPEPVAHIVSPNEPTITIQLT